MADELRRQADTFIDLVDLRDEIARSFRSDDEMDEELPSPGDPEIELV